MLEEKKLLEILKMKKLCLSAAESCSGGEFSSRITNVPGSSKVFLLGVVVYSNNAKNKVLKIPQDTIKSEGAVSNAVARLMSEHIRRLASSDLGIGITGIAGPGGGTKNKPVGTVFVAVSSRSKTWVKKFKFSGGRLEIKRKSADKAIEMLLEFIR